MLDKPVTSLPGVGKERAKLLSKLGLNIIHDVLFSYPRIYKDFSRAYSPEEVEEGSDCLVHGIVGQLQEKHLGGNRRVIQGKLMGILDQLTVSWFTVFRGRGESYLFRQLKKCKVLWVYGPVKNGFWGKEITGGEWYATEPKHNGLMPVYPLVTGVSNQMRISWAEFALEYIGEVYECFPASLLDSYLGRHDALRAIHFPLTEVEANKARERLVFEEFFLFQLSLGNEKKNRPSVQHKADGLLVKGFLDNLPFKLTAGQVQAVAQVRKDMESSRQMRRFIQGDVGSGKTIVSQYAAAKCLDSAGQVAVMVPTEVLARQMHRRFTEVFAPLGIDVALLIGNITTKKQRETVEGLSSGEIRAVVGTHALITDKVAFKTLKLAIIDEQHRFGVRQRIALSDKGNADLLFMSATPIPRSLALTLYGDLEITMIRDLPPGRKTVDTRLINPQKRADVYRFVIERVRQREQAFIIYPLVEETDKLDAKAAIQEMERLSLGPLRSVRVGLVHGQMGKEKEEVLHQFYQGQIDVLIATTVIEVGMDVPTATVMVIENADRFGLAQLHQLRGRVGRANKQAYCFLIADSNSENVRQRLQIIRRNTDGFKIAEEDLKLRGPGDLLGTRQSGEPWFKLANLIQDQDVLEKAARTARQLLSADPTLTKFPTLLAELKRQRPNI